MAEDIDRETMVSLLKDKAKENKQLVKKVKKLEEKYVELHKNQKALIKDRETFIQFLHLVFPQQLLDELLLPDKEYGLYDIEHLKQFWTHLKSQTDNESTNIIQVMKEEKQVLYQKIHQYERDLGDREEQSRRIQEMEHQIGKLMQEIDEAHRTILDKDSTIQEYQGKQQQSQSANERIRELERENSEIKAAQLMNMLGGGGNAKQNKQIERQLESLKLQLSEKSNDFLKLREENEMLRQQLEEQSILMREQQEMPNISIVKNDNPFLEPLPSAQNRLSNLSNNNSILEQSLEMDDPKYKAMETTIKEKEEEVEKLQNHNGELENKLQKLLTEFTQFRNKAQQMLTQKEDEIDKLKGRTSSNVSKSPDQKDSLVTIQNDNEGQTPKNIQSQNLMLPGGGLSQQINYDYVKNVFIKYLEYQANGNEKEALTLEKVLFTVLKATDQDIEILEKARLKNSGGLLSYFYSGPNVTVARPIQPRNYPLMPMGGGMPHPDLKPQLNNNGNGYLDTKIGFGEGGMSQNSGNALDSQGTSNNLSNSQVVIDNRKYFNINIS